MKMLTTLWDEAEGKKLYVKWLGKIWFVKMKNPFGFIMLDTSGKKAYITLTAKQKCFSLADEQEFKNNENKGD